MRNWVTEVLDYLGMNLRGKNSLEGAFRKNMDMGQAKQQHSPS